MSNAKKHHAGRCILKVIASILAIIVALSCVSAISSAVILKLNINRTQTFPSSNSKQLKLENYDNGCWNIYSDNGLKVLQITDVHLGGGWMSKSEDEMAMNAVAAMITAESPDFVVVTGDVAFPVPFIAGTFNNKSGAKIFAELMENLGVYWTITFGNHDTEAYSYYSREKITNFYSNYPHCLLQVGPDDVDGFGNQVFNIVNSDGIITRSLILLDSHSYIDGDIFGIEWKYDNIHQNQIDWYRKIVLDTNSKNVSTISTLTTDKKNEYNSFNTVKSTAFFHIPLNEYGDAWKEYVNNGYKDTDNVKKVYGIAGESGKVVYSGIHGDNLFETMLELNSTDTVFCGHDHLNNFSLNYNGISLTYGMSIDYLAYSGIDKTGAQRGCTVIEYNSKGEISYSQQNYYQDKYVSYYNKESVDDIKTK